jgi:hypothetical protein
MGETLDKSCQGALLPALICSRTSFFSVGNNPDGSCLQMCISFIQKYEAYTHSVSLFSFLINALFSLAGKASPMSNMYVLKFSFNDDSVQENCVYYIACSLHADYSV